MVLSTIVIIFLLNTTNNGIFTMIPTLTKQMLMAEAIQELNEATGCALLKEGADLESCIEITLEQQRQVVTLLQFAALHGCVNIIAAYQRKNPSLKLTRECDNNGYSLLHYTWHPDAPKTCYIRRIALTQLLYQAGLRNTKNKLGESVMDFVRCHWPNPSNLEAYIGLTIVSSFLSATYTSNTALLQ